MQIAVCFSCISLSKRKVCFTRRAACWLAMRIMGCPRQQNLQMPCMSSRRCASQAASARLLCAMAQNFYGTTLEALAEAKNERLWFKTQLKLCGLWFKLNEYGRLARILKELHKWVHRCSCLSKALMLVQCLHYMSQLTGHVLACCC